MFKLIVSDLDGTIIDDYSFIPKDNIKVAEELRKKHIPLVICTGKTYALSSSLCSALHASFGIFGNGSQILDLENETEIKNSTLSSDNIEACFSIAKKYNLHIHAYSEDSIITPKPLYMDLRNSKLFPDKLKFEINASCIDYINKNKPHIFKLIISSPNSLMFLKKELEKTTNLSITHIFKTGKYKDNIIDKEYEYLDISPTNVSKGTALKFLTKYLNLDKKDILSVGDNLNDIDMFKYSNLCIAVNNAHELVKSSANYITHNSAKNGGFAEAIYKFIPF